ncbi:hypothetical protein N7499_004547 [Penicillium canescens]|nr:hypothetical protein N7522_005066 [Penicillium canescens]KAJ6084918.1 hypothetical protein N7499_004547 [Penicillium canescens]KAJ6161703.1 hypothetical protein N7485_009933 [Penicillium canescens]
MSHSSLHHRPQFLSYLKDRLRRDGSSSRFEYINAAYYPSWRVYRGQLPSSLNLRIISHVFYAFLRAHEDGTIYFLDEHADTQIRVDGESGCLNAFKKLKKENPHLKIILSVGGSSGSSTFPAFAAQEASRRTFASTSRQVVERYGFDGIDVDWEHPSNPKQGEDYVKLLSTLREYLPSPRFLLTSALPVGEWCLSNIDLRATSQHCDFINLMTYDFAGSWTELSGHQAQLTSPPNPPNAFARRSVENGVDYLQAHGVSSGKTLIGIPVYGRSFLGVTGTGQPFTGHGGEDGIFEYKDLPRPGTQENIDMERCAAFCVGGDGGFVTYDNPETVQMKAKYVKDHKIAGLFYWTGTFDADPPRSLVATGYKYLNS